LQAAASSTGTFGARPDLGHNARRLLKQYHEFCKKPDATQIAMLAAATRKEAGAA